METANKLEVENDTKSQKMSWIIKKKIIKLSLVYFFLVSAPWYLLPLMDYFGKTLKLAINFFIKELKLSKFQIVLVETVSNHFLQNQMWPDHFWTYQKKWKMNYFDFHCWWLLLYISEFCYCSRNKCCECKKLFQWSDFILPKCWLWIR